MSNAEAFEETRAIIEVIAGAIRDELGAEIDAYAGSRLPEGADPINRAFRAIVRSLLTTELARDELPPSAVSLALRRVAERRLTRDGFDADEARLLLEEEPGSPEDWLIFLVLSSRAQVRDVLRPEELDQP